MKRNLIDKLMSNKNFSLSAIARITGHSIAEIRTMRRNKISRKATSRINKFNAMHKGHRIGDLVKLA